MIHNGWTAGNFAGGWILMRDLLTEIELNEIERRLLSAQRCHSDGVWIDTRTLESLFEMAVSHEKTQRLEYLELELEKKTREAICFFDEYRRVQRELDMRKAV